MTNPTDEITSTLLEMADSIDNLIHNETSTPSLLQAQAAKTSEEVRKLADLVSKYVLVQ